MCGLPDVALGPDRTKVSRSEASPATLEAWRLANDASIVVRSAEDDCWRVSVWNSARHGSRLD
jgi:hypothetical protein